MESINETIEIIKLCSACGLPGKFEVKRNQCRKCMSKKRYEINKKKNYYNEYYDKNKEVVLKCQHDYYLRKKEKLKMIQETIENSQIISENEN